MAMHTQRASVLPWGSSRDERSSDEWRRRMRWPGCWSSLSSLYSPYMLDDNVMTSDSAKSCSSLSFFKNKAHIYFYSLLVWIKEKYQSVIITFTGRRNFKKRMMINTAILWTNCVTARLRCERFSSSNTWINKLE